MKNDNAANVAKKRGGKGEVSGGLENMFSSRSRLHAENSRTPMVDSVPGHSPRMRPAPSKSYGEAFPGSDQNRHYSALATGVHLDQPLTVPCLNLRLCQILIKWATAPLPI